MLFSAKAFFISKEKQKGTETKLQSQYLTFLDKENVMNMWGMEEHCKLGGDDVRKMEITQVLELWGFWWVLRSI